MVGTAATETTLPLYAVDAPSGSTVAVAPTCTSATLARLTVVVAS